MKIVAVMMYSGVGSNSYEKDMIVRCLESLQGFVDGIVMLDTGGTPEIIEIAADYAVKLYHSEWTGNFSKHRNEALDYALAEYQDEDLWWLIIDPDESLVQPEIGFDTMRARIAKVESAVTALAVVVHEMNLDGEVTTSWRGLRFFRKSSNLKYKNIIHNKPVIDGNAAMTNIAMYHYGYSYKKEKLREKWLRTNVNLKKEIDEDPYNHRTCYYLAQNSASLGRYEEALFWGIRCVQYFPYPDNPEKLNFYGAIYYLIGMTYSKLQYGNESWRWLQHGLKLYPDDIDLNFGMALLGASAGRKDLFLPHAEKYLSLLEEYHQPKALKSFANLTKSEDELERNVHHISKQDEAQIRSILENWEDLFQQVA